VTDVDAAKSPLGDDRKLAHISGNLAMTGPLADPAVCIVAPVIRHAA
jgi:hypothetical protein